MDQGKNPGWNLATIPSLSPNYDIGEDVADCCPSLIAAYRALAQHAVSLAAVRIGCLPWPCGRTPRCRACRCRSRNRDPSAYEPSCGYGSCSPTYCKPTCESESVQARAVLPEGRRDCHANCPCVSDAGALRLWTRSWPTGAASHRTAATRLATARRRLERRVSAGGPGPGYGYVVRHGLKSRHGHGEWGCVGKRGPGVFSLCDSLYRILFRCRNFPHSQRSP
jgi:hypothetical protein